MHDVPRGIAPGLQIGAFQVEQLIGEGATGDVYLAHDTRLGRRVALKLIKPGVTQHDGLTRFTEEARTTASFNHPNIVTIHEFGEHDGRPYLALEYLDGETLRQRVQRARLPTMEALRIMRAIAEAMAEAHRRDLVHADLKPENVFIPRDGRVRVLDFGLARMIGASTGTSGTPAYMAPERWRGEPMTGAADVWALGLIMFELIAGRRLMSETELAAQMFSDQEAEIPSSVLVEPCGPLIRACLAIDPATRPAAAEVARRLTAILDPALDQRDDERGPFPGLAAFTRSDAGLYIGRQAELDTLVEQLRDAPLVPITGPSAIGKSSFVHAALLHRLDEIGSWHAVICRPGRRPFDRLAAALAAAGQPIGGAQLREQPGLLAVALRQLARTSGARILVFIDQFEELFTLAGTEAVPFCECLASAAAVADPWRIVLTVRNDFLGRLADAPQMRRHLGAVIALGPLGIADLRAAVVLPLARAGYRTDTEDLAARIASDVAGQPACLPLLQFTCHRLWQHRDPVNHVVLASEYDAMGGPSGALVTHAEQAIAQLSSLQTQLTRHLLLALVHPDGTRRPRLRSELLAGLPSEVGGVLDRLLDARLIVATREAEQDEAVIELAHEALTAAWPRLARWLDETYEERLLLLEIEQAALLWARRGHRDSETWTGAALAETMRRIDEWRLALPDLGRAFLDAGLRRDTRVRRRRRRMVMAALLILAAVAVAAILVAIELARREREAIAQQAQIRLASADIGTFDLELEPFDWDASHKVQLAPSQRPALSWQLRAVDRAGDDERAPGPRFAPGDLRHGEAHWHDGLLVERVEARSGPAYLEVDRGACTRSVLYLQHLPGYNERTAVPRLRVLVPTCQAAAADTIAIPAGEFLRNVSTPDGSVTRDERAHLDAFAIDRTEVTRAAFRIYGSMEALTGEGAARADDPQARPEEDGLPVVGINFITARDYCRFLGKDLPSVEQWQKALRGGLEIAGRPNPHPDRLTSWVGPVGPHPANLRYSDDSEIARVGSFPDDISPYGVVDMIGNVAEWSRSRPVATRFKRLRTVLGSSWDIPVALDLYKITFRNSRHDRYLDFTLGVRCVVAPDGSEPPAIRH